jgi:uncharacterized membrane-anchored protein YhcB (DUF1043 family)
VNSNQEVQLLENRGLIMWFPCLICLLVGIVLGIFIAGLGRIAKGDDNDD